MDQVKVSPADAANAPAPIAVSPEQAAAMLCTGRTTIFELMNDGELQRVKVGRRTLIPVASVHQFLARRVAELREAA